MKAQLWETYIPVNEESIAITHEIYIPELMISFGMEGANKTPPERYQTDKISLNPLTPELVEERNLPDDVVPLLETINKGLEAQEHIHECFANLFTKIPSESENTNIILTDETLHGLD